MAEVRMESRRTRGRGGLLPSRTPRETPLTRCAAASCITTVEAVRVLVTELAPQRDLFREYYSFDVVRSIEARKSWIAPDLKPLTPGT